ncbi:hypothetical protein A2U01_0038116, partial [Trifolium medium]|nr:hypothetical protein [Trifolium medium]
MLEDSRARLRGDTGCVTVAVPPSGELRVNRDYAACGGSLNRPQRFVTFYFTNFPEHIRHFHLRKALE